METAANALIVSSTAFADDGQIPSIYTCDGEGINPPLTVENIPGHTKSLVIIAEDPDAPKGIFDHWIVWNISPGTDIDEDTNPGISGNNSAGKTGYHPPCPPTGSHRYYFYIYALDAELDLPVGSDKETLKLAMQPHVIAGGSIMGHYNRR
jgi:Raf kinase inhibitor-like YbhB/YbcL family protein